MTITSAVHRAPAPLTWERHLRPILDAIGRAAPRAVLVGSAGSGKSEGMRRLQEVLAHRESEHTLLHAPSPDIDRLPRSHVLLVDDLHLWDDESLAPLRARADDPDAALIVAGRPWPTSAAMRSITRDLERNGPAVVLGHLLRSDLLDHLDERALADSCLDHLLTVTGGVSWLVQEALRQHDERDCADGRGHGTLDRAVVEVVAHRLDAIDPALRSRIEQICLAPAGAVLADDADADGSEEWTLRGYAEGLLQRNGAPVPLVRQTVRTVVPARRLLEAGLRFADDGPREADEPPAQLIGVRDERMTHALIARADEVLHAEPARAAELYRRAIECGAAPGPLAARRARAAWGSGDLEAASALAEPGLTRRSAGEHRVGGEAGENRPGDEAGELSDILAAIWSARGMMQRADAVHRIRPPTDSIRVADAMIASLGVGTADPPPSAESARSLPSALLVSMELLRDGLVASLSPDGGGSALSDLVRAAETFTAARATGPVCELPAVVAAVAALNLGMLPTARSVIDDAIRGDHGGPWARTRLQLWRAWIAVQQARPHDAREALRDAEGAAQLCIRDELLAHAVRVALARRYDDAVALEAMWKEVRGILLRAEIDLYLLHPLGEFVSAATRAGDADYVRPHLDRALEITSRLGEPPLWSAHARWAALQQGILLSRPDHLTPHAKALVASAGRSRIAASMARAGRVWTAVLAGTVEPESVIGAAEALSQIGLLWDAARLAGHGAARATDRRVSAQLLACARALHPSEGAPRPVGADETPASTGENAPEEVLSEREIEVAQLVLRGRTYAEIGDAIFISPRTVEHHVAHIRRRLGATSRSELLAQLRLLLGDQGGGHGTGGRTPIAPHADIGAIPDAGAQRRPYDPSHDLARWRRA